MRLFGLILAIWAGAAAGEVRVAVAANFESTARELAAAFSAQGHEVLLSAGATGQLYAQIAAGAPFDVYLAADEARPLLAETEGLAVAGSRFTYALGRLVLWSREPGRVTGPEALRGEFRRLAMANEELAPYGAAAREVLLSLDLDLGERIVRGNSIAQTYRFVALGAAELGFIASSQPHDDGSHWVVPQELYTPIRQDAVLLERAAGNEAARAFLDFLRGEAGRAIIAQAGYGLP